MKTVQLTGALGKKFGRIHKFEIKSPAEAIGALMANYPGFRRELLDSGKKGVGYRVKLNKTPVAKIQDLGLPSSDKERIVISPVITGGSDSPTLNIFFGVALIAVGAITGQGYLIGPGIALALGGVSQLLAPQPPSLAPNEATKPSYIFTGAVNTTSAGQPVPILYGRLRIGSAVISAGIQTEDIADGT